MHPVEARHQRIQALLKFTRNTMVRTGLSKAARYKLIDEYCMKQWALGATARRDYIKTAMTAIKDENAQLARARKSLPAKSLPAVPVPVMVVED